MFKKRKTNQKIKHKNVQPKNKGITLIALVVTIIVLVILAGVSINTLFGDNGLIKKANDSVDEDAKGKARDKVSMEVLSSFNNDGTLNPNKLKTNIENHTGGTATLGSNNGLPVTVTVDGYTFQVEGKGEITGDGEPATQVDYASEDTSFVGYYADLDGDASNGPEGIIYADLAVGSELALGSENAVEGMRKWNNNDMSVYKYDVCKCQEFL